jgi:crossover junction endodeoxyribonuclease RuvC
VRVMGVDPGLARCGVVVVDGDGGRASLATQQLIRTPSDRPVGQRLIQVADRVTDLLTTWTPDVLAIERLLFNANAKTAMTVAHAVGVILLASARVGVEVVDYTPTQVKATVTGHGDADKAQVRYLITAQLRLPRAPHSVDVSDAAAVALCHLLRTADARVGGEGEGHSARVAAALAQAGPGAQVVQPARPNQRRVRASGSEPAGGDLAVRASGSEPAGGDPRTMS